MVAAVEPFVFAVLAWGALALVAGVFIYEIYAIGREQSAR